MNEKLFVHKGKKEVAKTSSECGIRSVVRDKLVMKKTNAGDGKTVIGKNRYE